MTSVFVTGATGFIGSQLVARLLADGHRVRALVRKETAATALRAVGVEAVLGDVRDAPSVAQAAAGQELVYHLAKAASNAHPALMRAVNTEGTANVVSAAARAGARRLVHCSTAAVYGRVRTEPAVHEDVQLRPDSPYAKSKAMAEALLRSNDFAASLPVTVARITHVLGPLALGSQPLFRAVASRRFRLIGRGDNHYHAADVADVVDGLLLCGTSDRAAGRVYNLAGSEPIRLRELTHLIAEELGVTGRVAASLPTAPFRLYRRLNALTERLADLSLPRADAIGFLLSDRILDISRARDELGYAPRISIRETIRRTAEGFRRSGPLPSVHAG
jgi:nucleoside-diphosphate-sugar epimerase